jgi:hypothetical protein
MAGQLRDWKIVIGKPYIIAIINPDGVNELSTKVDQAEGVIDMMKEYVLAKLPTILLPG